MSVPVITSAPRPCLRCTGLRNGACEGIRGQSCTNCTLAGQICSLLPRRRSSRTSQPVEEKCRHCISSRLNCDGNAALGTECSQCPRYGAICSFDPRPKRAMRSAPSNVSRNDPPCNYCHSAKRVCTGGGPPRAGATRGTGCDVCASVPRYCSFDSAEMRKDYRSTLADDGFRAEVACDRCQKTKQPCNGLSSSAGMGGLSCYNCNVNKKYCSFATRSQRKDEMRDESTTRIGPSYFPHPGPIPRLSPSASGTIQAPPAHAVHQQSQHPAMPAGYTVYPSAQQAASYPAYTGNPYQTTANPAYSQDPAAARPLYPAQYPIQQPTAYPMYTGNPIQPTSVHPGYLHYPAPPQPGSSSQASPSRLPDSSTTYPGYPQT